MKNFSLVYKFVFLLIAVFSLTSCEEDFEKVNPPAAVDFLVKEVDLNVSDGFVYEVKVESTAPTNADRTFTLSIDDSSTADPALYTLPLTVTIPAGELTGSTNLSFDFQALDYVPQTLVLNFDEGEEMLNNTRTQMTIDFVKACDLNSVIIEITTDDYPEETSWELYDLNVSTSVPIMSQGPFTGQTNTTLSTTTCLGAGNYALLVLDSYGDGIVNGGYTIYLNGTAIASGTVAGNYAVGYFDVP